MKFLGVSWIGLLFLGLASAAQAEEAAGRPVEKLPDGRSLLRIEATPASIELKYRYDYRQLLLTGELDSGERVDVTRLVEAQVPETIVSLSPNGQVRGKADGSGEIRFTLNGQTATLNWTFEKGPSPGWFGVTVNFQLDGNYKQDAYKVYLDNLTLTYQ